MEQRTAVTMLHQQGVGLQIRAWLAQFCQHPQLGVTAEYTWAGSFSPFRDDWERLLPRLQPNLTKGIMCSGRSKQSKGDIVNVWLYYTEVCVCACVCTGKALAWQRKSQVYQHRAYFFFNLCDCHIKLRVGHGIRKIGQVLKCEQKKSNWKKLMVHVGQVC